MTPKRLVLFVEGQGDADAVPILAKKLLGEHQPWEALFLDEAPFRVGSLAKLTGNQASNWRRWLGAALKRSNVGAFLLLLDGDSKFMKLGDDDKRPFCAADAARFLAREAQSAGAGQTFSLAVVFAMREYESWFLAGIESLRGKRVGDGAAAFSSDLQAPAGDTDVQPRDAKGWLRANMPGGYKPTVHQAALTQLVELDAIRAKAPRSFTRFENAIAQLVEAIRSGKHVASPAAIAPSS